jgi:hypothetical protein
MVVAGICFGALGDPCNCRWIPVGLQAAQVKLYRALDHDSILVHCLSMV